MKFKGVIFDLDGTLLDTIEDIADSVNSVLKKHNFKTFPISKYKVFVGDGLETLMKRVVPKKFHNRKFISKLIRKMKKEYSLRWKNKTKVYPGVEQMLRKLQNKKVKIAVVSNKEDSFTKLMVKYFFPNIKFCYVVGAKKNLPIKPNPEGVLKIARKLNISPEEFLYIGDTATDMLTAVNAGMFPVGVRWGFRTKKELVKNGAKIVLNTPTELFCKCF